MAVITRYVVVRNGVELDLVFNVKKEADDYDKMLDAADKLSELIKTGNSKTTIDEKTIDRIGIFLAQNGPEVLKILKGVKPIPSSHLSKEDKTQNPKYPVQNKQKPETQRPQKKKN